jgi:hypothetical protein
VRLDHPRDLPGVAGHLERHSVVGREAAGEELNLLRLGFDPPSRADLALLRDRHPTELEVDVQSNRSHLLLLSLLRPREKLWANDTDAFALGAQPDKSQGRPPKSPGLRAHHPRTGLPILRSPGSPCPGQPTAGSDPDNNFPEGSSSPDVRECGSIAHRLLLRPGNATAATCASLTTGVRPERACRI